MSSSGLAVYDLPLPDTLTIRNAAEIKALVLSSMEHPALALDVLDKAPVDLSFIQIVEAARLSFAKAGKELSLAKPASGALLVVLERSGIVDSMSSSDKQFWLHHGDKQ